MQKFWEKFLFWKNKITSSDSTEVKEEDDTTSDDNAASTDDERKEENLPKGPDTDENSKVPATEKDKNDALDIRVVVREIKRYKYVFLIVIPIVLTLAAVYIYSVPRYYTTEASLAPEVEDPNVGNGLSSIASSFGLNMSNIKTTDAINPELYPDLMDDNRFVVDMFRINLSTSNDSIHTDYYTYLTKYQKKSWVEQSVGGFIKKLMPKPKPNSISQEKGDPYVLDKKDDEVVRKIRKDINIRVDKKTGVITISATAQDPLICKTLADSVTTRLQSFIVKYRTSKAQKDVDYYKKLMKDAKTSYEKVRREYGEYSDANTDVVLESVKSKLEDMENDMQLKYNQYTQAYAQYQAAVAKLLEKTPVFTKLKGASAPIKPDGPKRLITIVISGLFAFFAIVAGIIVKQICKSK